MKIDERKRVTYILMSHIYELLVENNYNNSESVNRLLFLGVNYEKITKALAEAESMIALLNRRLETLEIANINLTDVLNFVIDDDSILTEEMLEELRIEREEYEREHLDKFISDIEDKILKLEVEKSRLLKLKELN